MQQRQLLEFTGRTGGGGGAGELGENDCQSSFITAAMSWFDQEGISYLGWAWNTCYKSGCSSSSLADIWTHYWGYLATPNGINPTWPGHSSYP